MSGVAGFFALIVHALTSSTRAWMQGVKVFSSHTDWISSIAWSHISPHCILTTSYDKTAKLWDLRSSIPLQTLEGHGDKVRLRLKVKFVVHLHA